MVNATTMDGDASDAVESDGESVDWGPWYKPLWKWPIAVVYVLAQLLTDPAISGNWVAAVVLFIVGPPVLVYITTRVARWVRELRR